MTGVDRQITVLGGGIGGMAAAAALAQGGARVTVLERAPALREVGAGVQISPNGVAVLDALRIGRDIGMEARAVVLRDGPSGRVAARLPVAGGARPYLLCHRADLLGALAARAQEAGAALRLGEAAETVADEAQGAVVTLAGGARLPAGLVLGADGLSSVTRPVLNGPDAPFFTGQVAWRAVVPGEAAPEATVFMGPGRHLVRYPLPGGRINLVGVEERGAWAPEGWSHRDNPANLRAAFAGFCDEARDLLARVEAVHLWGLFRHEVARHWHGQNVALLGDAAHPTLPFLAQGANLALEDAWVLAACLGGESAPGAAAYQRRREARVRRVIAAAEGNAWRYHLRPGPVRSLAHLGLRGLSRLAPGRLVGAYDWLYGHDVTAAD